MPHDELGFDLVDGVHRHPYHDEERSSSEGEAHVEPFENQGRETAVDPVADERQVLQVDAGHHDVGNETQGREIDSANKGKPGQDDV